MEPIALVVVVAIALAVAGVLWWRSRRVGDSSHSTGPLEALDTLAAWQPTPTRIMTVQERLAYAVLVRALPDHMILAQVPLSRFLKVPTRNSYSEWLARVGQLCADLVVCDRSSAVLAVIDLRVAPQQASDRNRKRHDRMRRVLRAAGIPLHVWIENSLPTVAAAREAILPQADETRGGLAPLPSASAMATGQARTVLPTLDDETAGIEPDEIIELGEPPPSTWFDDFESRPTPLQRLPEAPAAAPAKPPSKQRRQR